jgi:peptide/nickel transport system substrate-binding protein
VATIGGGSLEALLVDVEEMIKEYWGEVGIDVDVQAVERSLYQNRTSTDEHDALMWTGWGGDDLTVIIDPRFYMPFATEQHNFAGQWASWYLSNGEDGEEPPEATQRQMELYRQVLATPDPEERDDLFRELIAIAKDEFYVFGVSLATDGYGIVANNFHNVPEPLPEAYLYISPAPGQPEQFFIDTP